MATQLAIYKAVAARLGHEVPSSTSDDVDLVIALNAVYDACVTEALTAHGWTFATKLETINVTATDPPEPYESEYAIPAGCLNIQDLLDDNGVKVQYVLVENVVWTHRDGTVDDTLTLKYTWWPSESRWPADFAGAIEEELYGRMLAAFGEPIRANEIREIANRKLSRAIARDRRQQPPIKGNRSPLLRAWNNGNVDRQ